MPQNIQFNKTVVNAVIIIVGGDGVAVFVICGTVHRRNIMNIHIAGYNHNAARMLTCSALNAGKSSYQTGDKSRMGMKPTFLVIFADIAYCRLVGDSRNGACAAHVIASEKFLRIFMSHALVGHGGRVVRVNAAGEVKVDIRNLVPMESQKNCKRNIVSVPKHPCSTLRAILRLQIEAAVHLVVQEKLAMAAFGATVMRL